jgi:hypothetical protein
MRRRDVPPRTGSTRRALVSAPLAALLFMGIALSSVVPAQATDDGAPDASSVQSVEPTATPTGEPTATPTVDETDGQAQDAGVNDSSSTPTATAKPTATVEPTAWAERVRMNRQSGAA